MLKIFVSLPMSGLERDHVLARMKKIYTDYCNQYLDGYDSYLINQFDKLDILKATNPMWCLGDSLENMADADVIIFDSGWQTARGCRIERVAALAYYFSCNHKIYDYHEQEGESEFVPVFPHLNTSSEM